MATASGSQESSYEEMMKKMHEGRSSNKTIVECSHLGERDLPGDIVVFAGNSLLNDYAIRNRLNLPKKDYVP